ncbi:MAG TPA: hypothetical protein VEO00_10590, partial [Actinomycetota bacterium]|nr:hypothetical protein [Actinomycetota bacterium]
RFGSSFDWRLAIKYPGDTDWAVARIAEDMWDKKGWAIGEVSKYGAGASADNSEFNLQYRNLNDQWGPWKDVGCWSDSLADWSANRTSGTEFKVVQQEGYCFD